MDDATSHQPRGLATRTGRRHAIVHNAWYWSKGLENGGSEDGSAGHIGVKARIGGVHLVFGELAVQALTARIAHFAAQDGVAQ